MTKATDTATLARPERVEPVAVVRPWALGLLVANSWIGDLRLPAVDRGARIIGLGLARASWAAGVEASIDRPDWLHGMFSVSEWLSAFHSPSPTQASTRAIALIVAWVGTEDALTSYRDSLSIRARLRFDRERRVDKAVAEAKRLNTDWEDVGPDEETRVLIRDAEQARMEGGVASSQAAMIRKRMAEMRQAGQRPDPALAAEIAALRQAATAAFQTAGDKEREAQVKLDERRKARWSGASRSERIQLEQLRGGVVETAKTEVLDWYRDKYGAIVHVDGLPQMGAQNATTQRILSGEGLRMAFEGGDLDGGIYSGERLYDTAKRFRDAYETYASMASPDRDAGSPSAPRCKPSTGPQAAAFEAGLLLSVMTGRQSEGQRETRRANRLDALSPMTDDEIRAVTYVCGRDETCSAVAKVMAKDHRTVKKLLRSGLAVATMNTTME